MTEQIFPYRILSSENKNEENDDDNNGAEASKDDGRIADLLGPWTIQTSLVTNIGHYKIEGHIVMYLVCDAELKGNACSIDNCTELNNDVCLLNGVSEPSCKSMNDDLVDWSDAAVFFYLGTIVDAGIPYNVHTSESTNGWVGPYNVILAQNSSKIGESTSLGGTIIDSYTMRFVYSPNTPYIKMPDACNLMSYDDFSTYLGEEAVNNTIYQQVDLDPATDADPFEEYLNTCDNGNLQPILPMATFNFVQDETVDGNETLYVDLLYKLVTIPTNPNTQDLVPVFQKHGAPISGPYCYNYDENGAYTLDLHYSSYSTSQNENINIYHACVEGLPCVPPPLEDCNCSAGGEIHMEPSSETVIEVGESLILGIVAFCLTAGLVISLYWNYNQYRRFNKLTKAKVAQDADSYSDEFYSDSIGSSIIEKSQATMEENDNKEEKTILAQPLLKNEKEHNASKDSNSLFEQDQTL